jgi:hypothetical protein
MPKGLSALIKRASDAPNLPSAPGNRYVQVHCWPTTSTGVASSGTVTNFAHTDRPGASIAAMPTEVMPVSHHSSFLFSGS